MPNSFERTALGLVKAALNSQQTSAAPTPAAPAARKPRVSTGRAMLLGAGLMVAGQALVKSQGRAALNSVRHGLAQRIDGTGEDAPDVVDDDEAFDEQPDAEHAEHADEPEPDEDEVLDPEGTEDEGPAERRPRRRAASRSRGRS